MRKLTYLLPAVLITGCSLIDQPVKGQEAYNSGCHSQNCAPGQSYSVANYGHNAHSNYGTQAPHQSYQGYAQQGYAQGVPAYSTPSNHAYGAAYGNNAPQNAYQGSPTYGAPHGLRGPQNRKPGNFYGTIGGVIYDTDIDSYGLEGRIGYDSGRILGAEVEGSIGIINEDETVGNVNLTSGFDYNVAAFALARLPLSERFSVHARGGYDFRKLSVSGTDNATGTTVDGDLNLDGFAYGVGGEFALTPRDGLRLDYTRSDNEFGATDSVSASYVRKF